MCIKNGARKIQKGEKKCKLSGKKGEFSATHNSETLVIIYSFNELFSFRISFSPSFSFAFRSFSNLLLPSPPTFTFILLLSVVCVRQYMHGYIYTHIYWYTRAIFNSPPPLRHQVILYLPPQSPKVSLLCRARIPSPNYSLLPALLQFIAIVNLAEKFFSTVFSLSSPLFFDIFYPAILSRAPFFMRHKKSDALFLFFHDFLFLSALGSERER